MTSELYRRVIVEGLQRGLQAFPREKTSVAALEVAARLWVERGLDVDDFVECARAHYNKAAGQAPDPT